MQPNDFRLIRTMLESYIADTDCKDVRIIAVLRLVILLSQQRRVDKRWTEKNSE